ncbi:porin [Vibrio gallaecicus]|uniref:porin n=1 Tax=Vibrio gallaecicus TaxID=552386 RepID=UPI0010C9721C|nr:porin [Vibrio gallaecicus]MDN3613541.1 porin [Vibrio gallaecicus]
MEHKFFKRTLLGAVIAASSIGSANAAVELAGDAVQFYGQAAGFMILGDDTDTQSVGAVIESRIGFRGVVEFDDFAPNLVWQIEGGDANNGAKSGQLGARDTYLGLDFEDVGSFKFGRQLVAAYNYVDWPHSNPGLGNVFDWNNDIGVSYQDRADNTLRFDSASFGGFNFQATLSGMEQDTDRMVSSIAASYSKDMFSVHAGYYARGEYKSVKDEAPKYIIDENGNVVANPDYVAGGEVVTNAAHNYAILGGSVFLGDLTLTAAYKAMETDKVGGGSQGQNAISATAQYVLDGKWVFKGGYAATDDADGTTDTGDIALTARLGYLLPSTYMYTDLRNYKMNNADDWSSYILIGTEYYF